MPVLRILLKRNRFWVMAAVVAALASNMSQIFYIFLIGDLVNKIEGRQAIESSFVALICIFMLSNALTLYVDQYVGRITAEKMAHSLRMAYARRLVKRAAGEGNACDAGAVMSVAQNELAQADAYLGNTFFQITGKAFSGVLVLIFLLFQDALLTMTLLIPTIFILFYVVWSGRRLSAMVNAAQDEKNRMNRVAYGTIHAFPVIRIFGGEDLSRKAFDAAITRWVRPASGLGRRSALYNTLSGIVSMIPLLLLLLAGSGMVIEGHIMLGTLIVFLNLQKSLTQFVMNLPSWLSGFRVFTANLSRIEIM
ncbi:MAG: hypothetical protein K6E50_13105 [Lachnospiraceae bacterium]|nr:hypothetical protein [Lachnospiraceae bacterium]